MADLVDVVPTVESEVDDLFGDGTGASDPEGGNAGYQGVGRHDDGASSQQDDFAAKDKYILPVHLHRHRTPKTGKEGSLRSLKVPSFLKWQPNEYKPATFEPTEWDIENAKSDHPKQAVRWKRDDVTGKLKSNALVHRWSDGSLTLTVGDKHYALQEKVMAPSSSQPYQETLDSHYYAAAAHLQANSLVTVGHISEQLTVLPGQREQEASRIAFAAKMAEAHLEKSRNSSTIFTAAVDPELDRKNAEVAEKEQSRLERKRLTIAARGGSKAGGAGTSAAGQEAGGRAGGGARKRGQPGAARGKKRKPEYDSDDDLPEGRGREDEYDREDDFIAPSDEESASGDDGYEDAPQGKRQKKSATDASATDASAAPKGRRRNVVDDDEGE